MPQYRPVYRNPSGVWMDCETVGISYHNFYHPLNINLRETNNMTIPGIPSGWKPVAFREAKNGDHVLTERGEISTFCITSSNKYLIVERIIELQDGKYYKQRNGQVVGPMIGYKTVGNGFRYTTPAVSTSTWSSDGICGLGTHADLIECVDPPKPKYRPFKDGKEFSKKRSFWFRHTPSGRIVRATTYDNTGVFVGGTRITYKDLLDECVIDHNDEPLGILNT